MDIPENLVVWGDKGCIRRAVSNALRNAVTYAGSKGPIRVRTGFRPVDNAVLLRVVDSGDGVPEAELPSLTEPFFRGAEAQRKHPGRLGPRAGHHQEQHRTVRRFGFLRQREAARVLRDHDLSVRAAGRIRDSRIFGGKDPAVFEGGRLFGYLLGNGLEHLREGYPDLGLLARPAETKNLMDSVFLKRGMKVFSS